MLPTQRLSSFVENFARCVKQPMLLLIAVASIASPAAAQAYRTDQPVEAAKRNAGLATGSVLDPSRYATEKVKVLEYFNQYYFPAMTRTGPDELRALGDLRYNLFKRFLWATTNEEYQRDLTMAALQAMGKVVTANPPYHPAVRYNAILIIGMLDQQYAIENQRPPTPLAAATTALTKIVDRASTDQFPPPVTLGALVGLERHTRYKDKLDPAAIEAISAALLKLVNEEKPIQEMDRDTFAWLQLRAAGVLAQIGSVGKNNGVHDGIIKLVEKFKSLDDRAAAAALLAKIKYEGAKVDGAPAAEAVLKLARDMGEAESKRAEEFEEGHAQGGSGAFMQGRGEFMPGGITGEEEEERFPRRHVLARLTDLKTGLTATKPIAPKVAQARIDAVLKAIEPAIKAAQNKELVELRLTGAIHTMAGAIDLAATPPKNAAAEEENVKF